MPASPAENPTPSDDSSCSVVATIARIYWMIAGHCLLYLTALAIMQRAVSGVAGDLLFWMVVSSLIGVRYLDVQFLGGATADGRRAARTDWAWYSKILGLVAFALWVTSRALAKYEIW